MKFYHSLTPFEDEFGDRLTWREALIAAVWDTIWMSLKAIIIIAIGYALLISFSEVLIKDLPAICAEIKL